MIQTETKYYIDNFVNKYKLSENVREGLVEKRSSRNNVSLCDVL